MKHLRSCYYVGTLARAGIVDLLIIITLPNTGNNDCMVYSPIHDHAGSECFMRTVAGELNEIQYAWADRGHENEQLKEIKSTRLHAGDVAYITGILLHETLNQ
jgi:sorbitol-specific phosphotransferase system component IIA